MLGCWEGQTPLTWRWRHEPLLEILYTSWKLARTSFCVVPWSWPIFRVRFSWHTISWRYYSWPGGNIGEVEVLFFIFFWCEYTFFQVRVFGNSTWDSSFNFYAAKYETLDGKLFFSLLSFFLLVFTTKYIVHHNKGTALFLYVLVLQNAKQKFNISITTWNVLARLVNAKESNCFLKEGKL